MRYFLGDEYIVKSPLCKQRVEQRRNFFKLLLFAY